MKSFRFEAAQVWNSLPNEIRLAENFNQFKRLLRTWDGMTVSVLPVLVDFDLFNFCSFYFFFSTLFNFPVVFLYYSLLHPSPKNSSNGAD